MAFFLARSETWNAMIPRLLGRCRRIPYWPRGMTPQAFDHPPILIDFLRGSFLTRTKMGTDQEQSGNSL